MPLEVQLFMSSELRSEDRKKKQFMMKKRIYKISVHFNNSMTEMI
jgi:hypothetical protein